MRLTFLICATVMMSFSSAQAAETLIKDAENPARTAFQASATVMLGGADTLIASVPVTKRLVIEHVSMDCVTAPGYLIHTLKLKTTTGENTAEHRLIAVAQGPDAAFSHFAVSQAVRIYADGPIRLSGKSNHSQAGGQCNAVISGHLVTLLEFNGLPRF